MATKAQRTKAERAAQRFVKALLAGRTAILRPDGSAVLCQAPTQALPQITVQALSSAGVLGINGDTVTPRVEAATWLRRVQEEADHFATQHRTLMRGADGVARNLDADAILKLSRGGKGAPYLAPHQIDAAGRVCKWAEQARLTRRVTMSYTPLTASGGKSGKGGADVSDMAADARKKLQTLHARLPRDCADALLDVCVYDKSLGEIERSRQWPKRSAKLVLRIGLDLLACELGLSPQALGPSHVRQRGWRDPEASMPGLGVD